MKNNIRIIFAVALFGMPFVMTSAQETLGDRYTKQLGSWNSIYEELLYYGDETTVSIYLPNIESIESNAMLNTPNVRSIEMGRSGCNDDIYISNMGVRFFYQGGDANDLMANLTEFVMYQPGWCEYPYAGWWSYPSQLTFVPYGMGSGCSDLKRVVLPKRAQCIMSSFEGCAILPTVTLPECAGYISGSFNDCASLRDIRVRSGYVTEIEDSFGNLPEDAVIYVPRGFKDVYENSAWGKLGCTIVEDADYDCGYTPEQLPVRGWQFVNADESTDVSVGMAHYHFEFIDEDGDPVFYSDGEGGFCPLISFPKDDAGNPYNVVAINDYTFCGNVIDKDSDFNFEYVFMEPSECALEHIGAFVGAYITHRLYVPALPEGLKTIGRKAFSNSCFGNETLSLPSTLESIGDGAFDRHSGNLTTIRCAAAVPPVCGDARVFGDKSRLELVVPEGSYDLYYDAPVWRAFSRITEDASLGSVDSIMADIEGDAEAEYYTLDGHRVAADALTPGIYVVRRGASVSKTLIR